MARSLGLGGEGPRCGRSTRHSATITGSGRHWRNRHCANLNRAPPDELTTALRSGLPVVLWHPDAEPEHLRAMLDWCWPRKPGLSNYRIVANWRIRLWPYRSRFLAHDLVVMWDDPNRVIVLVQPLIPTRP
ncbi:hypothetical protein [Amycolatopsis sp. cmx-11-12]|uniref:VMAP-C domain-containing protein n=1 Tax=Amycolatopsis sp. cmx-11-12 TaxID=2785795 RepID=UPI003917EF8B